MSKGVHWSLSFLLLGWTGIKLLVWLSEVLLKFGKGLLIGLLPLIELSWGKLVSDPSNNTLAGFSSWFFEFSARVLLNISSKVIPVISSLSSSRFSVIKKELFWLVGVWTLEIPVVIWLSNSLSISESVVAGSVDDCDSKYIVLQDGALENSVLNNCYSNI